MKTLAPIFLLLLTVPTFTQVRESNFDRIFNEPTIPRKKEIWRMLPRPEQVEVRRMNFQWGIERLNLNPEQLDYLARFSAALPTITRDEADEFQKEALELFDKDRGALLFGSIGPYENSCSVFINASMVNLLPGCPCSIGSKFNMSCSGSCAASTGCNR
jgi:hypothetical protein